MWSVVRSWAGRVAGVAGFAFTMKLREDVKRLADENDILRAALRARDATIAELEAKLNIKPQLRHERNAVWKEGDPTPHCSTCYEVRGKLVHLIFRQHAPHWGICFECNKGVQIADAPPPPPRPRGSPWRDRWKD